MKDFKRYSVHITGIVQGVGMRPFLFRGANKYHLGGWVSNHGAAVDMEITGRERDIRLFMTEVLEKPPAGAKISSILIHAEPYEEYRGFAIRSSSSDLQVQGFIPPDTAICEECIKEVSDMRNHRYQYPFTCCTACGPRYSIIKTLPYDRVNTSMSAFEQCPTCRREYENLTDRRFHSQTNCCSDCGPRLTLYDNKGREIDPLHPVKTAGQLLLDGKIIGIKGIGGYHLACNAQEEKAIELLRIRKGRPEKPLAVMAANSNVAKLICRISEKEEEIITGRQRPILLLEKGYPERLPQNIAPGIQRIGVMLPYTPLHYLLLQEGLPYLVMTSGNISGQPICYKDEDAFDQLKDIADYFLIHDREIVTPIDDSVVRVIDGEEMVSRLARGYAPYAVQTDSDYEIIAVGAEQKASICLLHKGYAHITQYLGNISDMDTYDEYLQVMERMKSLLQAEPQFIAHDLHPGYLSTQWAMEQPVLKIPIQHHYAHMAACMAEHHLYQDAIGIIYDGTGSGTDGAIWGGEFLIGSGGKFSRAGHWEYVTLQGGESAIREPWKAAAAYLETVDADVEELLHKIDPLKIAALKKALRSNVNCFQSSSIGRLFDCAAAMIINRLTVTYDAQAAIELESVIDPGISDTYEYTITDRDGVLTIGYRDMITGILEDKKQGKPETYLSAKFHNTVCAATIDCACRIKSSSGLNNIVLGGGVFENGFLLRKVKQGLKNQGFYIYHSNKIPINDGGISFGQAAAAAYMVKEGVYVSGNSG